jgi:hypothetical protein
MRIIFNRSPHLLNAQLAILARPGEGLLLFNFEWQATWIERLTM